MERQILKNKKILILEDDDEVTESLRLLFESEGCVVITVSMSAQVIPLAENEIPDLFILDIMLPDESGVELFAQLKKHPILSSTPVIFLTGVNTYNLGNNWSAEKIAEQYFVEAPQAFIEKPFEPELLINEVVHILQQDKH